MKLGNPSSDIRAINTNISDIRDEWYTSSMKEVKLDGKTYIRTAAAAKQFTYSQDYLGQLAREGRIAARRVGRTWFVNPESIAEYQRELEADNSQEGSIDTEMSGGGALPDKHVAVKADNRTHAVSVHVHSTATTDKSQDADIRDRFKEERGQLKSNTNQSISGISDKREVKSAKSQSRKNLHVNKKVIVKKDISARKSHPAWYKVAYEPDESELHPTPKKEQRVEQRVEQEPELSTKSQITASEQPIRSLRVHSTTDKYTIVPSQLPSVRLRGRVKVSADTTLDATLSSEDVAARFSATGVSGKKKLKSQATAKENKTSLNTKRVETQNADSAVSVSNSKPSGVYRLYIFYTIALLLTLFLLVYLSLSLTAVVVVDVTTGMSQTQWHFDFAQLQDLQSLFFSF